ncbi:SagB/ThcOx family dehydrogenase [Elusimicrobiota bacterium]
MNKKLITLFLNLCIIMVFQKAFGGEIKNVSLPQPKLDSSYSLERAILKRRSVRNYINKELDNGQISQVLWSAQGITNKSMGFRSAPSAGAIYPIELLVLTNKGVFIYYPDNHSLGKISSADKRSELSRAAYSQGFISDAGMTVVVCANYSHITKRYGSRGIRYADMEAGHIAQNIHLQAVALELSSVPVAAFSEEGVHELLNLSKDSTPIYIISVGYKNE